MSTECAGYFAAFFAFAFRAAPDAVPAFVARAFLSATVIVCRERLPPILPPFAPCFRRNARTSGGSLFAIPPILTCLCSERSLSFTAIAGLVHNRDMKAIGYVRVSTEKQADFGVSLEAQTAKIRAMAVVQGAELVDVLVDAGESAKSLHRPGMARLLAL